MFVFYCPKVFYPVVTGLNKDLSGAKTKTESSDDNESNLETTDDGTSSSDESEISSEEGVDKKETGQSSLFTRNRDESPNSKRVKKVIIPFKILLF